MNGTCRCVCLCVHVHVTHHVLHEVVERRFHSASIMSAALGKLRKEWRKGGHVCVYVLYAHTYDICMYVLYIPIDIYIQ